MYTTTWDEEPELKSPTDDIFQYTRESVRTN